MRSCFVFITSVFDLMDLCFLSTFPYIFIFIFFMNPFDQFFFILIIFSYINMFFPLFFIDTFLLIYKYICFNFFIYEIFFIFITYSFILNCFINTHIFGFQNKKWRNRKPLILIFVTHQN